MKFSRVKIIFPLSLSIVFISSRAAEQSLINGEFSDELPSDGLYEKIKKKGCPTVCIDTFFDVPPPRGHDGTCRFIGKVERQGRELCCLCTMAGVPMGILATAMVAATLGS